MANVDTEKGVWEECNAYIARTRKRSDGIMGDFVKYYNGAFSEPGNFGRETVIARDTWHPRIVYLEKYGTYLMSGTRFGIKEDGSFGSTLKTVLSTSDDLVNWTEQVYAPEIDGKVYFKADRRVAPGSMIDVKIRDVVDYDLYGRGIIKD